MGVSIYGLSFWNKNQGLLAYVSLNPPVGLVNIRQDNRIFFQKRGQEGSNNAYKGTVIKPAVMEGV